MNNDLIIIYLHSNLVKKYEASILTFVDKHGKMASVQSVFYGFGRESCNHALRNVFTCLRGFL